MLASERHREILNRLQASGGVRVASLASELTVTQETIRRDLERLDAEGKLIRTHGGAMVVETDRRELPLDVRETINLDKKRAVARRAVLEISAGDVIGLDASSTARELARLIPDIPVTVVTNALPVASALLDKPAVRVIMTGGILDRPSMSLVGPLAEQALDRFHVQKLFFSCRGLDLARGLSVTADEHAGIKRRMIDLSEKAYLLIDSSKLGVRSVEFFAPIDEMDMVIVDDAVSQALVDEMRARSVQVELA
ncbi:MAG: DeoR/GlpR family DNA-binding transcription regulator [Planctomycetota bacterium]